jgi:hypothetical protein
MTKLNANAQTGALTLVLLVKSYKPQMIALLVKNGIVVNNDASDEQVVKLMVNLLKVSKSYFQDLNNFVTNPAVANVIAGGFEQTTQYLKMTGDGYMNVGGFLDYQIPDSPFANSSTTNTSSKTDTASSSSFWGEMKSNIPNWISDGIKLFGTISTNKANAEIANAQVIVAQNGSGTGGNTDGNTGGNGGKTPDEGMSTTSIVLLSLLGVAVLGTAIYFVVKQKK